MNSAPFKYQPLNLDILDRIISDSNTCILLDNARPSPKQRYSYLIRNPVKSVVAHSYDDIESSLQEINSLSCSSWVFGYITYEASYSLEKNFSKYQHHSAQKMPLLWFAASDDPWIYDHEAGVWNKPLPEADISNSETIIAYEKPKITHLISKDTFKKKIKSIKDALKQGDTYQVNYTYDVSLKSGMSPFSLYRQLREMQRTPYCGFIKNTFGYVASFSPELFFRQSGETITVKPMKGTIHRGHFAEEDRALVQFLENDSKNRAENLMIVDLLRNDLGKICKGGTVATEKLFEVETHPTLHQMTSTIIGTLQPQIQFSDLIKSIFPCGSVTGAPKIRTMEIIHELEEGQRGVYCGALGYLSPKGDAMFNVPIRTLQKEREEVKWKYRVGCGVVWDSDPDGEWKECTQKCRFLEYEMPEFELLETMLYKEKFIYAEDHLSRMNASADYFSFPFSQKTFRKLLKEISHTLHEDSEYRVRILLDRNGTLRCEKSTISLTDTTSTTLSVSRKPVDENNPFLFHKTTHRPWYKVAMREIARGKCFDVVFMNLKGEITEGAISTIFTEKNSVLYTPPLSCGILPGILRKNLLTQGTCKEKILRIEDLLSADTVYCGNSVRGLIKVDVEKN